jgi:hypothetical protein
MTDTIQPNPLEDIFNITPGTTPVFIEPTSIVGQVNERAVALVDPTTGDIIERSATPDVPELEKEERIEDLHIDGQLESVHNVALIAFEKSSRMSQEADPRFAARNAEVAAQYLNIALNAVNSRVDAKFKRQKIRQAAVKAGTPGTVNNNIIVADRNELLKQIFGEAGQLPITPEEAK